MPRLLFSSLRLMPLSFLTVSILLAAGLAKAAPQVESVKSIAWDPTIVSFAPECARTH